MIVSDADLATLIAEIRDALEDDAPPVRRLAALDTPVPFSRRLENLCSPRAGLAPALRALLAS